MSDSEQKALDQAKKVLHRKKHKNSRLGCPQCKQRRIKCDETLPSCKKCSARAIRCGYLDFTHQELNIIRQAHMDDDEVYNQRMGSISHTLSVNEQQIYPQVHQQQQHQHQQYYQDYNISQYQQNYPQQFYQQYHESSQGSESSLPQFQQPQQPYPQQSYPQQHVNQPEQYYYQSQQEQQHFHPQYTQDNYNQYENHQNHHPIQKQFSSISEQYHHLEPAQSEEHHASTSPKTDPRKESESSEGRHPIEILSETVPQRTSMSRDLNSSLQMSTPHGNSSISSYSSKMSPFNDDNDQYGNMHDLTKEFTSPQVSIESKTNPNEIPLVRHQLNTPEFNLLKFPEFLDETIPNAFARVFLLKEVHQRLRIATKNCDVFYGLICQGIGKLTAMLPHLEGLFFKYRGRLMNVVRNQLSDINDRNAELLLILTSLLNSSSIYIRSITMKDFFSLASGPSVILKTAFEDPDRFKRSFIKLKNHADGLFFTSRSVWNPRYNHKALFEFLEVVKEFGSIYIDDDEQYNDDDTTRVQFAHLVEFIEFALEMLEGEESTKHVLRYPIDKIYKLVQLWYFWVPSEIYTFGSKTPKIEKVFYVFWYALGDMLEEILVGGRYIFTFLFNGFYLVYPFTKEALYYDMIEGKDDDLKRYANYSCRIIAFLNRRKAYVIRNTVLNDPIPTFFDVEDRFKPRSLDIHERCITSFKKTVIKPFHYPSEAATSGNLTNDINYYKTQEATEDSTSKLLNDWDALGDGDDEKDKSAKKPEEETEEDGSNDEVDLLNVNERTNLLKDDFDPRFSDPIFQTNVVFQNCDLDFLNKYHEDRKLIIQLDMKD